MHNHRKLETLFQAEEPTNPGPEKRPTGTGLYTAATQGQILQRAFLQIRSHLRFWESECGLIFWAATIQPTKASESKHCGQSPREWEGTLRMAERG